MSVATSPPPHVDSLPLQRYKAIQAKPAHSGELQNSTEVRVVRHLKMCITRQCPGCHETHSVTSCEGVVENQVECWQMATMFEMCPACREYEAGQRELARAERQGSPFEPIYKPARMERGGAVRSFGMFYRHDGCGACPNGKGQKCTCNSIGDRHKTM